MIKLVKRNEVGFSSVVKEALKHELYIPGYTFQEMLENYDDLIHELCILYDEEPIGLGMVWEYPKLYRLSGEHIGIYIRPDYRRQGLGSKIVEALGGLNDRQWRPGIKGSGDFWLQHEQTTEPSA